MNRSISAGSHLLAFLLTSLTQLVPSGGGGSSGQPTPLSGAASGSPPFVAIFAHDFNLLYLRRLLKASWLTDSWQFDAAPTGSSLSLELWADLDEPGSSAGSSTSTTTSSSSYRVVGVLEAATIEQQSSAVPLVPPHAPPARSIFFNAPLDEFTDLVLSAINPRCIAQPLRQTVEAMMTSRQEAHASWAALLTAAKTIAVGVGLLIAGFLFGFLTGREASTRAARQPEPLLSVPLVVESVGGAS